MKKFIGIVLLALSVGFFRRSRLTQTNSKIGRP